MNKNMILLPLLLIAVVAPVAAQQSRLRLLAGWRDFSPMFAAKCKPAVALGTVAWRHGLHL